MLDKLSFKYILGICVLFSTLLVSCEADVDLQNISNDIQLNSGLILPLGDAKITLEDLIMNNRSDDDVIRIIDGEICYQTFDSASFSFRNINLVRNSQEITKVFHPSASAITYPSHSALPVMISADSLELGINHNIASERVDSVWSKSARIRAEISLSPDLVSIRPSDITLTLIFPNGRIRKINGASSSVNFIPTTFGVPGQILMTDFVFDASVGIQGIPVQIRIDAKTNNSAITVSSTSILTCKLMVTAIDYSVLYGYFEPDVMLNKILRRNIDVNQKFSKGLYRFLNPKIEVTTTSNIGTYLGFQVDSVRAFVKKDPSFKPIYAWFNGHTTNSTNVLFDKKPMKPGDWVTTKMRVFDKDWGETAQLFDKSPIPDVIEYKFSTFTNKTLINGDPSPNFITPDGIVKVKTQTTIPLYLNAGSYHEVADTIDNLYDKIGEQIDKYGEIEYAAVVLKVKNGLPARLQLTIKLLDAAKQVLTLPADFKTVFSIEAAKVNDTGEVIAGNENDQVVSFSFNKSQLDLARKAKSMVYIVRIEGLSKEYKIHLQTLNTFDMNVGFFVKGELR